MRPNFWCNIIVAWNRCLEQYCRDLSCWVCASQCFVLLFSSELSDYERKWQSLNTKKTFRTYLRKTSWKSYAVRKRNKAGVNKSDWMT
jgi:hypothetical protein